MPERTCTNCGASIPDGARFCTSCGTEAPAAAAPEPYTEPVAPTTQLPAADPAPSWTPPPAAPQPQSQSWSVPPPAQSAAPPQQPAWQQPAAPPLQPAQQPAWQQPQQQWPAAQPQYAAAAPAKRKGNAAGALLSFLGAILLVVGASTQWVRTNVDTHIGWNASTDGKVVVALGVVALIIGFFLVVGLRSIIFRLLLLGLGVWAIVIAIVDMLDVNDLPDALNPAIGIGLVLVLIGGVVLVLAGIVTRSRRAA